MAIPALNSEAIRVERERVLSVRFPLDDPGVLNVLRQTRKTMQRAETEALATSIFSRGQLNPGRVAVFDAPEARKYLSEINELFGTSYTLRNLRPIQLDGIRKYLIVIFGHRRLNSCVLANRWLQEGSSSDHFDGSYECDLHFGLSFDDAITMQFTENHHVAVPLHEEIEASWLYWRFLRKREPNITPKDFARRIGRKVDWVRDMIRFTSLPESLQKRLQPDELGNKVSYGIFLQLVRKREAYVRFEKSFSDEELESELDLVIVKGMSVAEYTKLISAEIEHLSNNQIDLFGDDELAITKEKMRKIACAEMLPFMTFVMGYLGRIKSMDKAGRFGEVSLFAEDHGEFSPQSPSNMIVRIFEAAFDIAPDFKIMLRRDKRSTAQLDAALAMSGMSLPVVLAAAESSRVHGGNGVARVNGH